MSRFAPVVFDATHSCQQPGAGGTQSGGQRDGPDAGQAAVAAGADALFLEVHDNPPKAKSDAATVWPLDQLAGLLADCVRIAEARRDWTTWKTNSATIWPGLCTCPERT